MSTLRESLSEHVDDLGILTDGYIRGDGADLATALTFGLWHGLESAIIGLLNLPTKVCRKIFHSDT